MSKKKNVMLACPYCLRIPQIYYVCGEYFTDGVNDCCFCHNFNEMSFSKIRLKSLWNDKVKLHHKLLFHHACENLVSKER